MNTISININERGVKFFENLLEENRERKEELRRKLQDGEIKF